MSDNNSSISPSPTPGKNDDEKTTAIIALVVIIVVIIILFGIIDYLGKNNSMYRGGMFDIGD
jgi:hypothetical protein